VGVARGYSISRLRREYPVATAPDSDLNHPTTSTKHCSKARKFFLDDLSNSVRPFDYMVKAGQLARPKT
jgi:hypothetical protein